MTPSVHCGWQVAEDADFDWAARYEPVLRAVPLAAGGLGIVGVLANRLFSGVRISRSLALTDSHSANVCGGYPLLTLCCSHC